MHDSQLEKREKLLASCKPCYNCGEQMTLYQRMKGDEELTVMYEFLECDECRTVSSNTTSTHSIEDVVNDWNRLEQHREMMN
jgi:hypothetical protein